MDPREEVRLEPDPVSTDRYERERIETTKREAAATHPEDPKAYIAAKTETVASLLADARDAGYTDQLPVFV